MSDNWISDAARDALWFSAKIRFTLTRDNTNEEEYEDRIYLFQYPDPDTTSVRAVEIGKGQENEYKTDDGKQLQWRFREVLNVMMTFLDIPLDQGLEIYSERIKPVS